MKTVLILGGTNFIGRNTVKRILDIEEFQITLFNRGITNPKLFKNVDHIFGDREKEEDLNQVFSSRWDLVLDFSGYFPKSVRQLTSGINKDLSNYIYISSCSVYDNLAFEGRLRSEKAPILECTKDEEYDTSNLTYGKRKAACENVIVKSNLPYLILRPALVFGPHDQSDRLYYWLYQLKAMKKTILPEAGKRQFSMTYVNDIVKCVLHAMNNSDIHGTFNCVSHPASSILQIIQASKDLLKSKTELINISSSVLKNHDIAEWTGIPLWLNSDDFTYSNESIKKHLSFIPTEFNTSISETISFFEESDYYAPKVGISNTKQTQLLKQLENNGKLH